MKNFVTIGWNETLCLAYESNAIIGDYCHKYYTKEYAISRLNGMRKRVHDMEHDIKLSTTCAALSYSMIDYSIGLIEMLETRSYILPMAVVKELDKLTEMSGEHAEYESYNTYLKGLYDTRHNLDDEWIDKFFSAL